MFPILVKLGPITIHTYGFMMAVGVAFGIWFIFVQAKKQDLDASKLVDMVFFTVILALIGAKAVLLIGKFSYYTRNVNCPNLLKSKKEGTLLSSREVIGG